MRTPRKSHDLIRQNEVVKKSQKHDSNLQKNSTLYFQVGLIICLLITYGLFEMKFETRNDQAVIYEPDDLPTEDHVPIIFNQRPSLEQPVKKEVKKFINDYKKVEDITPDDPVELKILDPVIPENPLFDPDALPPLEKKPEEVNVPINFVQHVPIYPGCEKFKDNKDRRNCMSEKITKLIQRKFNTNIASEYGLSGIQKIAVAFKIDKTGHVTDIKTRSPHPKLDEEAQRVINLLPEMTPGKQNHKNVGVIYNLPINFQVQD